MHSRLVHLYLLEDAPGGDITSQAIFGRENIRARAVIVAKENLVVSGFSAVQKLIKQEFPKLKLKILKNDGRRVKRGTCLALLTGPIQHVLLAERTCLNFLQHLSGIATRTQQYAAQLRSSGVSILDTRKTMPGYRQLEKKAVRDGGGFNHRMNLSDQYLIKDNHIQAVGSLKLAVEKVREHRRRSRIKRLIEVEVKTLPQFREALSCKPDIVMLDNMSLVQIRKAVLLRNTISANRRPLLEISGGVNLKNIRAYFKTGVERISTGEITHSAPAVDISLEVL